MFHGEPPFRPLDDRLPAATRAYVRWEGAHVPSARDAERFELDTLASRRAAARPSLLARVLRRARGRLG